MHSCLSRHTNLFVQLCLDNFSPKTCRIFHKAPWQNYLPPSAACSGVIEVTFKSSSITKFLHFHSTESTQQHLPQQHFPLLPQRDLLPLHFCTSMLEDEWTSSDSRDRDSELKYRTVVSGYTRSHHASAGIAIYSHVSSGEQIDLYEATGQRSHFGNM